MDSKLTRKLEQHHRTIITWPQMDECLTESLPLNMPIDLIHIIHSYIGCLICELVLTRINNISYGSSYWYIKRVDDMIEIKHNLTRFDTWDSYDSIDVSPNIVAYAFAHGYNIEDILDGSLAKYCDDNNHTLDVLHSKLAIHKNPSFITTYMTNMYFDKVDSKSRYVCANKYKVCLCSCHGNWINSPDYTKCVMGCRAFDLVLPLTY
jgi:hypothetical protein